MVFLHAQESVSDVHIIHHLGTLLQAGMHRSVVCCRLTDLTRHLFNELGSAFIQNVKFRDVWAFVGYKGIKGFTDIEQVNFFDFLFVSMLINAFVFTVK